MSFKSMLLALAFTAVAFSGMSCAAPHKEKEDKQAILIASFGTSVPSARKAIDNLVATTKKAFPGVEVRLAFTSNIIRRKLKREGKKNVPSTPVEALAALNDEGFNKVCVVSTHIIPGAEYDDVKGVVKAFSSLKGKYGFKKLTLGKAALNSVEATPHHIANAMYCQLQVALNKKADGRFFIGTVENTPLIEDVIAGLKKAGYKKALLSPLMVVAGDHAQNDLAGKDDPESWLNLIKKEGIAVDTYLYGLGEDKNFAAYFVNNLKAAMN